MKLKQNSLEIVSKMTAMTQLPRLLSLPLCNWGPGLSTWENLGIKDACRWVL